MAEGLTKKQFKELRKLEKMQAHNIEEKNGPIKLIAILVACALFLVLFIGVIFVAKTKNKPIAEGQTAQIAPGKHVREVKTDDAKATDSAAPIKKELTLVEYSDIQCPVCQRYQPIVTELLKAYPNQLKLVFKHFPLPQAHPNAEAAAVASEAVARQGKFFEFLDIMYERQPSWEGLANPQSKFEEFVKELKLDVNKFREDQKDPELSKLVEVDRNEGIKNGVNGTPAFYLNGKKFENPASLEDFKKIIDAEIGKTDAPQPTEGNAAEVSPTTSVPKSLELQQ